MSIKNILDRKGNQVVSIRPDASLKSAADLMRGERIAALVVKGGNGITAIFSERDLLMAVSEFGQAALSLPVGSVANKTVVTITSGDSLKRAMGLMTQYRVRHLPVLDGETLQGIVSIGDVVKNRLDDLELESSVLRDSYLATRPLSH